MNSASQLLTIRCGFELVYESLMPTPASFTIRPRLDPWQRKLREIMSIEPNTPVRSFEDSHSNIVQRLILPPGSTTIKHDFLVSTPPTSDEHWLVDKPNQIPEIPPPFLRYLMPSRYCDSDHLMAFAQQQFSHFPEGLPRVQAICDWVYQNIEYRWGSPPSLSSASQVLSQGHGVCRDFAHLSIALSRCFNIPTRYVTGYVPDIGCHDLGIPMDFHAYMQVYVGRRWYTFDARFNEPRIGRVNISFGLDAVDGAFSTLFGESRLAWFQVWSYQIDPLVVHLGDPIDLSKRLDGTPILRFT